MRVKELNAKSQKTEKMIIGHPRMVNKGEISESMNLNDSEIKRVAKMKSLGAILDERLNWDDQFNKVKGKVSCGLKSSKKLQNVSQSQLDYVYRALVESHLHYANVIWVSPPKAKLNTLQRLEGKARSITAKARLKDNLSHNLLTVEKSIQFDRSVMTYKIVNRPCLESLWDKYHHRTKHSSYRTRNRGDLQIPKSNIEYVKKRFPTTQLLKLGTISPSTSESFLHSIDSKTN